MRHILAFAFLLLLLVPALSACGGCVIDNQGHTGECF
jgi:hypothetical protein